LVVNKIQAKSRDKSLNSDDYKILKDIKRNIDENELEFCINVLLESKKEAKLNLDQMERKEYYKTLPIFCL